MSLLQTCLAPALSSRALARQAPRLTAAVALRGARSPFSSTSRASATPSDARIESPAAAEAVKAYNKALEALQAGDYEKAATQCQAAIEMHGSEQVSSDLLFALGVIQQQGGKIEAAIASWQRVLQLQADRADVHTNLAASYMVHPTAQNPSKAREHIVQAQQLDPLDKEITFNAAVIHEALGDLEQAQLDYGKARDLGVPQADVHLRNIGGKILRKRLDQQAAQKPSKDQ